METGNPNVVYHLENDIDCSTFDNFEPIYTNNQPFQGYLDGRNHVIKDLVIKVPPTYTEAGLFPKGYQATVKNLYFHHLTIDCENDNVGALFGQAYNCTVENCHLSSYDDEKLNYIKGKDNVGGWIGNVTNAPYEDDKYTYVYNCTVHNTQIYGKYKVGGHVGICDIKTHVSYCTNRGVNKDKYYNIVNGTSEIGGIIGSCRRCNLTYSGVLQGEVFGYENQIGALMGYAGMSYFHDLYAKEDVVVTCGSNQGTCATGGLVGRMNYTNTVEINYYSMYSKAYVRCSGTCGGLYGYAYYNTPTKLNFTECYSSAYLVPTDTTYDTYGNIFGYIDTGSSGFIQYSKVYYNSDYNQYNGSGKVEGTNQPIGQPEAYSCQNLYQQINTTYTGKWQGHALGYEYDYSYKEPNCSVRFYQPYSQITTPPVTAAPTEAPYRR